MSTAASLGTLDGFLREQLDVLITVRDNIEALRRIALHYTNVPDAEDFVAQVNAIHADLGALSDAAYLLLTASEAGVVLLTAEDAAAQRAALGLGSAALAEANAFAAASDVENMLTSLEAAHLQIAGLLQTQGNQATQAALTALANRVGVLEADQTAQDLVAQLIADLQAGEYDTSLWARIGQLQEGLTLVEGQWAATGTSYQELNAQLAALLNRMDDSDASMAMFLQRVGAVESDQLAAVDYAVGLATRLADAESELTGQALALFNLSTRTEAVEGGMTSLSQATTTLQSQMVSANAQIAANSAATQELQTQTSVLDGMISSASTAITDLSSRVEDVETGLLNEASAREELTTRVEQTEFGVSSTAASLSTLTASLSSGGNLLWNAGFETDLAGWELYSIGADWAEPLMDRVLLFGDTVAALRVTNVTPGFVPTTDTGARSVPIPIEAQEPHIISGWIAGTACTGRFEYRVLDADGEILDVGEIGSRQGPVPGTLAAWPRVFKKIIPPPSAVAIEISVWGYNPTGPNPTAVFCRGMIEQVSELQEKPSPWSPSAGGLSTIFAQSTDELKNRVTNVEGAVTAQSSQITNLTSIIDLQPKVYLQPEVPAGTVHVSGDMWVDTNAGNKVYLWDGDSWEPAQDLVGNSVFTAIEPPALPTLLVGDLWFDTNDGNKQYIWDGDSWEPIGDQRITATATAVASLTSRVQVTEDKVDAQAAQLVTLDTRIASNEDEIAAGATADAARATAIEQLTTRVTETETDIEAQTGALLSLTSRVGTTESVLTQEMITRSNQNAALTTTVNGMGTQLADLESGLLAVTDAVETLETGVSNIDGVVSGHTTSITNLQTQVNALDADTGGVGSAIATLDSRVQAVEGDIDAQGQAITDLQNSVVNASRNFVQPEPPATEGRSNGDLWIDSNDNNKIYAFDEATVTWIVRADTAKNTIFVQPEQPTAKAVNDLWFDSNDGNKGWRWDGTTWIDNTDVRTLANAAAIQSLTNRTTLAEGNIAANSGAITTLQNTVNNPSTGVVATASGLSSLTTRVTSAENVNTTQGQAITTLQGTVNNPSTGVVATASGLSALTVRVTSAESINDSQGSALTSLQNTINDPATGLGAKASSSALTDLTNRVTVTENTNTAQAGQITGLNSSVGAAQASADGKGKIIFGSSAPLAADRLPQNLWIDTTGSANTPKRWDGTAWVQVSDKLAVDAANAAINNASAISGLTTRVTQTENTNSSQATALTDLGARVTTVEGALTTKASSTALATLTTRVDQAELDIDTAAESLVLLDSRLDTVEGDLVTKASSTALTALTTRVTNTETENSTQAGALTSLDSRMYAAEGAIETKASSTALTNLTTRVADVEGVNSTQAGSITNLNSRMGTAEGNIGAQSTAITTLNTQVSQRSRIIAQASQPSTGGRLNGDMWVNTGDGNKIYIFSESSSTWVLREDQNKISVHAQPSTSVPTGKMVGDLWFQTNQNNRQMRWDGDSWEPLEDPRISATSTQVTQLTSTVNGKADVTLVQTLETNVNTELNGIKGQVYGQYTLYIDVDGYIGGFRAINGGIDNTRFEISADVFKISKPGGADGLTWSNNVLSALKAGKALKTGAGFGASNDLLFWYGGNMASSSCSFANAEVAITTSGKTKLGSVQNNMGSGWDGASITYSAGETSATISVGGGYFVVGDQSVYYSGSSTTVYGSAGASVTYWLYYDDAGRAGGSKTLNATTDYTVSFNANNRVLVGAITVTFATAGGGTIGGGGGRNCPHIEAWVITDTGPKQAGDVQPGDMLLLCDPDSLEEIWGEVSASQRATQPGVRITAGAAQLTCSSSAPIPTLFGYVNAIDVLGHMVVCRVDGQAHRALVDRVTGVGEIPVQHITVGDRNFWVGDDPLAHLLHHNIKMDTFDP